MVGATYLNLKTLGGKNMKYKKVCVYCESSHLRSGLTPICQSCYDEQMQIKIKGSAYVSQHERKTVVNS